MRRTRSSTNARNEAGQRLLAGTPGEAHSALSNIRGGGAKSASARKRGREEDNTADISFITWNIDGLRAFMRDSMLQKSLRNLLLRRPAVLCLLEHKLQADEPSSNQARKELERMGDAHNYDCTWTFSPRKGFDGLLALVRRGTGDAAPQMRLVAPPSEPTLRSDACARERRLLHVEYACAHLVLAYAPNSGREGRLDFRINEWEPAVRALLCRLSSTGNKVVIFQGDLNVAHRRECDCWGDTDGQWGGGKASGRTPDEQRAFDALLSDCGMLDGFRARPHPGDASATCWHQKANGAPGQRAHWKRYDYALMSNALVSGKGMPGGLQLVHVRHHAEAFEGGRPDHLPIESVFRLV